MIITIFLATRPPGHIEPVKVDAVCRREVAAGIHGDRGNRRVADGVVDLLLGVSQRTIEVHRAHVTKKFTADSLAELVSMVVRARTDDPL